MARKQDTSDTSRNGSPEAWKQRKNAADLSGPSADAAGPAVETKRASRRSGHEDQDRAEFAAQVAHELRAPITVINGNARLLHDERAALSSLQKSQALADICDEAERMRVLVEDLMTLAVSPKASDVVDELEPLGLQSVLESVVARHRRRHPERTIEIEVRVSRRQALGVRRYVEQIVDNLVSNAVKYSAPQDPILIVVSEGQSSADVRVMDRGIGLDPQHAARVFKPYFRAPKAAAMASGTGIGLVVSKRLAEAQGGRIWAQSRAGGGSEFGFSLPVARAQAAARQGASATASKILAGAATR